ncbi:MAG: phage major capsid protein [Megasphaera micronuciformis]|nr:phage major capsid protein [Megasphaera micronuciformis]
MTEKERELRQSMAEKQTHIQNLLADNRIDEAESATEELKAIRREFDIVQTMNDVVPAAAPFGGTQPSEEPKDVDTTHVFAQLLRNRHDSLSDTELSFAKSMSVRNAANMNESAGEAGGFIVPKDLQTKINELKRALNPLSALVRVENVNTLSGARVLETASDMTPLAAVAELAAIGEIDGPKFTQVKYVIRKFAGILPISEELLADSDQNLLAYVNGWLAKKSVATENAQILAVLKTLTKAPLTNLDGIKDILNATLDPTISLMSSVLTNQDGFNFLDKQKDTDGRYLLQPNPLDSTQKLLFGKPVTVVSNKVLPTDTSVASAKKAPVIIGSFTDAVVLFDRQATTLTGTSVGGDAWKRDSYDVKAVTRIDVQKFDDKAVVFGELTI